LPIADCRLPIADCRLPAGGCRSAVCRHWLTDIASRARLRVLCDPM
jgi:hypothetical protein